MRIFLVIFAALIVAAGTGYYLLQELRPPVQEVAEAEVEAPPTEVYVPAVALTAGSIIQPEHLGRMPVADNAIRPEMVVADEAGAALLVGSVARQPLPRGFPIARSAVVQPGERGFLAAVLPQGKRAISIPIGEVAGVSGLAQPGDRVDIILTYAVTGTTIDADRDIRASETVLSNLRVLALDQRLQARQSSTAEDVGVVEQPVARTATLEVTPQQAEMLTLATRLGDLSLVLNSIRDGGEPEAEDRVADAGADAAPDSDADADPDPLTLVGIGRPAGQPVGAAAGVAEALMPRAMTLDSDVTSLLQRQAPAAGEAAATVPLAERIARVQVVRGIRTGSVSFGGAPGGGDEAAADVTTPPVAAEAAD